MKARLSGLLAAFALLGAAAPAVAPAAVSAGVKRVLADYRNDGKIEPCRHPAKDYRDTLEAVQADQEQYAPDFPSAVEAALEARARGDCEKKEKAEPQKEEDDDDDAAAAPAAPAAPAPAAPAAPAPDAAPAPAPAPAAPTQEVVPEPPAPPGAGVTGAAPPPQTNKPDVVLTRPAAQSSDVAPAPLIVLGGLLAASLLAALVLLAMRRLGWGEQRLAGARHAVGEAGFRTGGTWQNFTDWVRLGR